jgi:hypothetical protein
MATSRAAATRPAIGNQALYSTDDVLDNTGIGASALYSNTFGAGNTAIGSVALYSNTMGSHNVAVGDGAGGAVTTGSGNIALGAGAGSGVSDASSVICIGTAGFNVSNSCFVANIRGAPVSPDALPVLVDSSDKLGTASSSRRFKKEIKPMGNASETILALKPVTFHYKSDMTSTPQFGLIAEEVAEVNPDLVVRDENGEIYTVRYEAVNAMLLNEFLEEHKRVEQQNRKLRDQESRIEEQEATITQLKKEMQTAVTRLNEQDSKIQRVSVEVEMSKPAPQVVFKNP